METTFTVNGHKIVATLAGNSQNPPVFLLHGLMSHRGVWKQTLPVLEKKYYCIAPDLLGFGASDKPADADYGIVMQARRILAMADALKLPKFSVMGHSMGGQIAMSLASMLAPERVERLVSVGGVVTGQLSEQAEKNNVRWLQFMRGKPWLYGMARRLLGLRFFINFAFDAWFYDIAKMPASSFVQDAYLALNPEQHISIAAALDAIHALDVGKHLHKVKVPTLLIYGEDDKTVPVEQAYIVQSAIPQCNLALLKKCGHFPMYEKTGQYLKALGMIF